MSDIVKFIHVSDLHLVPKGDKLWGLDPFARFEACLDDIARLHRDAAFVVISGDLAERGEVLAYRQLKARLADFPIATHLMLGNHETAAISSRSSRKVRAMREASCKPPSRMTMPCS